MADGKTGVSITLKGKDVIRTVQLTGTGSLFTVAAGVTLILDENICLNGVDNNNTSSVTVNAGGALELKDGARISGNANRSSSSGSSVYGGGVYVATSVTITMQGGEISGNTASSSSYYYSSYGGGVYAAGTFTMEGGTIYGSGGGANANKLEGRANQGVSVYKDSSSTAAYGNGSPIIAGTQTDALYTNATLTGRN